MGILRKPEEVLQLLSHYKIPILEDPIEAILGDPKTGMKGFKLASQTVPADKTFVALGSMREERGLSAFLQILLFRIIDYIVNYIK